MGPRAPASMTVVDAVVLVLRDLFFALPPLIRRKAVDQNGREAHKRGLGVSTQPMGMHMNKRWVSALLAATCCLGTATYAAAADPVPTAFHAHVMALSNVDS